MSSHPPTLPVFPFGDLIRTWTPGLYWAAARRIYVATFTWNTLAASATTQASDAPFTVPAQRALLVSKLHLYETQTATGTAEQTPPDILIQIKDSSTTETWFSAEMHVAAMFGTGGAASRHTWDLEQKQLLKPSANVTITLTNLSASVRRIWLGMEGALLNLDLQRI